ncbi:FAR1 DNA binding domain, zinc finger, SWIM-type, MULE transposase domain containing protein [Tanacetum coccineum]|uniref:FAR1 DNA binding domain, zinc finger, SWIM-type, MULE transposase domain containing protein n=1 Tax=Tanacetum coccineum TaxID=301880 RepID=A0ABQ4WT66_9ASTR
MSDVQSQNDATNMMIHNIDVDQEVSYIESVPEPQSVGNVRVTPRGSRYWTPVVPENEKPVKKMLFVSLDQAIEFYNNYAKKAGFEPRRNETAKRKYKRLEILDGFDATFRTNKWIPSYFRDLPLAGLMQTTSRCEGENYFFGLLTNTDLFLVEFINHFETAMDAQRNIQRNNDHDSRYKAPQLRTSFQFEKEAAEIFTIAAFKVIQSQIVKSMIFCMSYNVTDIEGGQRYFIKDVDDDVKLRGDFQVDFVESEIKEYPKRYILRRWTKDVVPPLSCGSCFNLNEISEKKDEIQSLIRESVFFLESAVDRLVNDVSKLSLFRDKQKELMEQVFDDMPYQPPMKNKQVIETILGVTQPDEIEIGNPNISSNKGGIGGKKRLISLKDKAIAKAQKTNLRRCNYCEQLANHDSRNCPVKKKDEEDQRKKLEAQEKSEANKKRGANHQASTSGSNV